MEGLKNLPKSLPESEVDFEIDVNGEYSNRPHKGQFRSKILTLRDQALVAKHKAHLNGDIAHQLDLTTLKLHQMISYLKYALKEVPKWWRDADFGYELLDMNVVEAVYNQALDHEEKYLRAVWGDEKVDSMKAATTETEQNG